MILENILEKHIPTDVLSKVHYFRRKSLVFLHLIILISDEIKEV